MSTNPRPGTPELPPFSLDVQALDLGAATKAVGLELLETESREPVRGEDAAKIWAAALPAVAGGEPYVLDFFSHADRVREFCAGKQIAFRDSGRNCIVVTKPSQPELEQIFARFERETFGFRCGTAAASPDEGLESELSRRGLDAYQDAYMRYTFCAICEAEDGWVTLLSGTLWPSEVIRRTRPALQDFDVHIARPQ